MNKKDKIQNMDCSGCKQRAIKCGKCIRKIMEYWDVEDFYTKDKIIETDINK